MVIRGIEIGAMVGSSRTIAAKPKSTLSSMPSDPQGLAVKSILSGFAPPSVLALSQGHCSNRNCRSNNKFPQILRSLILVPPRIRL